MGQVSEQLYSLDLLVSVKLPQLHSCVRRLDSHTLRQTLQTRGVRRFYRRQSEERSETLHSWTSCLKVRFYVCCMLHDPKQKWLFDVNH